MDKEKKDKIDFKRSIYNQQEKICVQISFIEDNYFGEDKATLIENLEDEYLDLQDLLSETFDD